MSKAMLIMDMPSCCDECDLKEIYCFVDDNDMCRAAGCPLRKLPQKQTVHCTDTTHHRFAKDGWNACIDEILKEGAK